MVRVSDEYEHEIGPIGNVLKVEPIDDILEREVSALQQNGVTVETNEFLAIRALGLRMGLTRLYEEPWRAYERFKRHLLKDQNLTPRGYALGIRCITELLEL